MIGERTLKRWRKEALIINDEESMELFKSSNPIIVRHKELRKRILLMTQELLDQHLIRRAT